MLSWRPGQVPYSRASRVGGRSHLIALGSSVILGLPLQTRGCNMPRPKLSSSPLFLPVPGTFLGVLLQWVLLSPCLSGFVLGGHFPGFFISFFPHLLYGLQLWELACSSYPLGFVRKVKTGGDWIFKGCPSRGPGSLLLLHQPSWVGT